MVISEEQKKILKKVLNKKDIKVLCKWLFPRNTIANNLTPTQVTIVRMIAFSEHRRLAINCYTRYGKTQCVAIGVAIYVMLNPGQRIALIGPREAQANILRNYIAELMTSSTILGELVDFDKTGGVERLKREVSRKRITFKNGCELITLSAEGEAERLMGRGASLVIKDESCLIGDEANAKIVRMLGDQAETSILVEISNPWNMNNKYYEHWTSPRFHTLHVPWQVGVEEGRITEAFVEEMRDELTDLQFTVLYDSEFPKEADDQLISYQKVKEAVDKFSDFKKKEDIILSCDPADRGMDFTVIMATWRYKNHYLVREIFSESKSDNMNIAGRLLKMRETHLATEIKIDRVGLGTGVLSRVKEVAPRSCKVIGAHFGMRASKPELFANAKAEGYWRLKKCFDDGRISIPNHPQLIKELISMRWEHTSSGKLKIIDPSKSPDFADCLVIMLWGGSKGSYFIAG